MNSFYTSTNSLYSETSRIKQYLESKFRALIFNPFILEHDIDYKSYCSHYNALKDYSENYNTDSDIGLIREKFNELPVIRPHDFEFSTFGLPLYLLFVLFPLNVLAWGRNYKRLAALRELLTDAKGQLGTIEFMLKAAVS
jgi:hypothetical protein